MSIDKELFLQKVRGAVFGFVVGDALGVPVEFTSREERMEDPVANMRSGGVHGQAAGTWSDDTSMTICVMDSLIEKGIDYEDQMRRFEDWLLHASNTAHDEVFDVGGAVKSAIFRFAQGTPALECGGKEDYSCGNGSLMRMLPTVLYLIGNDGDFRINDRAAEIIHTSSQCTHAHKRCQMACGIYAGVLFRMAAGGNLADAVKNGILDALSYYGKREDFAGVCDEFEGLETIGGWEGERISGSGYVVHTLQASLWCLLTTDGYAECVLKAVNLGEDTDTTAAVAGSLAGLWYGYQAIPRDWIMALAKNDEIDELCRRFGCADMEE